MKPYPVLTAMARAAALLIIALAGNFALAPMAQAVTCSTFAPASWSLVYDPNSAIPASTISSVALTCTRQAGDGKTATLTISANSGLHPAGTINQAISAGSSLVQYNNYTNNLYTLVWGTGGSTLSALLTFGGVGSAASVTVPFYALIPAGQTTAPAGTYTDTVTLTLLNGVTPVAPNTASFTATVTINPYCKFSTAPGAVSFSYNSLQTTAAAASSSFGISCTNLLPYSVSLDLYSVTDSAVNLAYTLNLGQSIRPAGSAYSPGAPLSAVGNGTAQTISIDGSMAAGQAGTCNLATCTNAASTNNVRTLTITY